MIRHNNIDGMFDALPINTVLPELIANLRAQSDRFACADGSRQDDARTAGSSGCEIDGRGADHRPGAAPPRRAQALGEAYTRARQKVGDDIGYHVRLIARRGQTHMGIIVMTPGILLRMLQDDPYARIDRQSSYSTNSYERIAR